VNKKKVVWASKHCSGFPLSWRGGERGIWGKKKNSVTEKKKKKKTAVLVGGDSTGGRQERQGGGKKGGSRNRKKSRQKKSKKNRRPWGSNTALPKKKTKRGKRKNSSGVGGRWGSELSQLTKFGKQCKKEKIPEERRFGKKKRSA